MVVGVGFLTVVTAPITSAFVESALGRSVPADATQLIAPCCLTLRFDPRETPPIVRDAGR